MKKLIKFIAGVGAIAGGVCGVLYVLDKYKKKEEAFDAFEDEEFEDVFADEEDDDRDYVTIDLEKEEGTKEEAEE